MFLRRAFVIALILFAPLFGLVMAGPRAGLLIAIGIGFGLVLEGLRFGFAGPWRMIVAERDGRGLLAQFLAIGLVASVAFPLLAAHGGELSPAHAPIGLGMVLGAFVFGAAMQLVMGCGSGTLVNAGSGNLVGLIALLGFIGGSFAGSLHLGWWTGLASLPVLSLQGLFGANGGLVVTLAGLAALAALVIWRAAPGKRLPPVRLWWAAALIAALALANLVVAGQPWGIVYGLGLWGAKIAQAGWRGSGRERILGQSRQCRAVERVAPDRCYLADQYRAGAGGFRGDAPARQSRRARTSADRALLCAGAFGRIGAGLFCAHGLRLQCRRIFQRHLDRVTAWLGVAGRGLCRVDLGAKAAPRHPAPRRTAERSFRMTLSTLPRQIVGLGAVALVGLILALDLAATGTPDLFDAPSALALGSGQAPSGAHCTAQ